MSANKLSGRGIEPGTIEVDKLSSSVQNTLVSAASNVKSMRNDSGVTIPANKPVSKKSDGSIIVADSDSPFGQHPIGFTTSAISDGQFGDVFLLGNNISGLMTGLGFAPGDEIYLSENAGFTNDPNSFTNNDDSLIRLGIADCADGVVSGSATDLITMPNIIYRP